MAKRLAALILLLGLTACRSGNLTYDGALALARQWGAAYDSLPASPDSALVDKRQAQDWAAEIVPEFEQQGAVDKSIEPLEIIAMLGPSGTECVARRVTIRVGVSIIVMAHELTHIEQGYLCDTGRDDELETTAQIVALEVGAALVNKGDCRVTGPLLAYLRNMALGTARSLAFGQGGLARFYDAQADILHDPAAEARLSNDTRVLRVYNAEPLNRVLAAIQHGDNRIDGLLLPNYRPFMVDDLALFLTNIDSRVMAARTCTKGN